MILSRSIKHCLVLVCVLFFAACAQNSRLPEYYNGYLDDKIEEIVQLKANEADCFFYWTDTHFPDNSGYAPEIMNYIQDKVGPIKKFYGGDATKNAPALSPAIDMFASSLEQAGVYGMLYLVRGNHDFTSTTSSSEPSPETMDNLAVNQYLSNFCASDIVKDEESAFGNYYYLDCKAGRIRYVVFDSTDNVADAKIEYGISDRQINWIFNHAVATLPDDWSLIFLSHVPFDPNHTKCDAITQVADSIAALNTSKNILLCLAGHRHADLESGIGSVFQVLTEADCLEDCARTLTPYSLKVEKKCHGTVNEQTLDYVSVSADHSVVTFKRIGHGYDRVFNLRPIDVMCGEIVKLPSETLGSVRWTVYDAASFVVGSYDETGVRYMEVNTDAVEHIGEGYALFSQSGNYIAVALSDDGTKRYYMLAVKN